MENNVFDFLSIDKDKKDKLLEYARLVLEYNKSVNITGANDIDTFINEHIIDSLLAYDIFKNYDNIIDIGCGAGLPSIPLSIVYPYKHFTLCESKNKKANFLLLAKDELSLNNIEVKCINAYEIKEKYDTITSRAFSDIKTLLKIFNKIKSKNANLVLYKARRDKIDEELNNVLDIKKYDIKIIDLNAKDKERHIIILKNK